MPFNSDPMLRAKYLLEGMWQGDLNDLLSPVISIDEYESKVDENAIVIGFFIHDVDAAADLNRFIQKSTIDILYSEVSPAPDQRGYYIVFVEMMNNEKIVDNIIELVEEVTFLTNVEEWQANVFGSGQKTIDLSVDELTAALGLAQRTDDENAQETREKREVELVSRVSTLKKKLAAAADKLRESSLDDVEISNGHLILCARNYQQEFEVVHVGSLDGLDKAPFSMEFNDLKECRAMAMNLGEGWDVTKQDGAFVLFLMEDDSVVKLKPTG